MASLTPLSSCIRDTVKYVTACTIRIRIRRIYYAREWQAVTLAIRRMLGIICKQITLNSQRSANIRDGRNRRQDQYTQNVFTHHWPLITKFAISVVYSHLNSRYYDNQSCTFCNLYTMIGYGRVGTQLLVPACPVFIYSNNSTWRIWRIYPKNSTTVIYAHCTVDNELSNLIVHNAPHIHTT